LRNEVRHALRRISLTASRIDRTASRVRWGALAGRERGRAVAGRPTLVFLHGLTFDRRMWDPVLAELPAGQHAIALDLPGHGGSPALARSGLAPVVEALHAAVEDGEAETPIVVGHSIAGPIAAIYAATHASAGVVGVDAPLRLEPFAEHLLSLRSQLEGPGFAEVWARFRAGWRMDLVPAEWRELLRAGEGAPQQLVLAYQADLLERPLAETIRRRDEGLARLRQAGTPYLSLQASAVDAAERAWLAARLPRARTVVWPVGHHFPQLADPARFAALVTGFAAAA
jgi:pimeloyl-ACP methyl ester carboxylesterase